MLKKNKVAIIKEPNCLNCGYPFNGQEKFCPDCGQKNKTAKITFKSFLAEIFNGFISWDAKFWKTIIPLIIAPGKVSKDYVEGKRMRYANPFRFYLTVSIIFFLIIGLTDSYSKLQDLRKGNTSDNNITSQIKISEKGVEAVPIDIDSIQKLVYTEINKQDSIKAKIANEKLDSIKNAGGLKSSLFNIGFNDSDIFSKVLKFQKKHPNTDVDTALDSLQMKKTFGNRFLYSRVNVFNSFISKKGEVVKFRKKMLSYSSIALFILLPLFTLFLRFIYIRRKFTYVEHLVFVFHVQTVFFLLFSIFYIIDFTRDTEYIIPVFTLIFLIYLFLAMKKFYGQGVFKTFIKYLMANFVFFMIGSLGAIAIMFIAFALY